MAIGHSVANLEYDSEQDDEYYDEESSSDNSSYPSDNGRDVFELIPI